MLGQDEFLWSEIYRPCKVSDVILPKRLKDEFQEYVRQGTVPNLLLCGSPGCGKTTMALALMQELSAPYIFKEGTMNTNMDALRVEMANFASTMSLQGRKYIIIDEADYLSAAHVQPALRSFIQTYSDNCGFIFTANYKNRIIEPLLSRFAVKEFTFSKDEKVELAKAQFERVLNILGQEKIKFDKKVVAELVQKFFPDLRKVISELQSYSIGGSINTGVLTVSADGSVIDLLKMMKDKDFTNIRRFVTEGLGYDQTELFNRLYEILPSKLSPMSMAQAVLVLGERQYKGAFVANPEINMVACCVELMSIAEWR